MFTSKFFAKVATVMTILIVTFSSVQPSVATLSSARVHLNQSSRLTFANSGVEAPQPGHWVSIGPALIQGPVLDSGQQFNATGRLMTMAVDPTNSNIIYVGSPGADGTEGSGVWKTMDGGNSWTPITDDLPSTAVHAIAIDPTDPNHVYIVLFEEGLYRSDDAGVHWIQVSEDALPVRSNLSEDGDRTVLLINPEDPQTLYLTTDLGVQRSTDGGKTWPVSLGAGDATSLVMDPQNPKILYAAISNSAGALGIYKTVDGGALGDSSWTAQTQSPLPFGNMPRRNILLAIGHPDYAVHETVYALFPRGPIIDNNGGLFGGIGYDLFQTTDGENWSKEFSCFPDPNDYRVSYVSCNFAVISANPYYPNIVYLGGVAFWYSFDGGEHFNQVPANGNFDVQPSTPHVDYWQLVTDPFSENILYAVSDGGIYKSSSHGIEGHWEFIGQGITNAEMHDVALAKSSPNRAIAGTQDNGNMRYTGSLVWDHLIGGDGGAVAIDPNDADAFYASFNEGSVIRSLDGGDPLSDGASPTPEFKDFRSGISPDRVWQSCHAYDQTFQLLFHPNEPHTLLDACGSLWRTTDTSNPSSTGNWSAITPEMAENVVRVAIDRSSDTYYIGTNQGHLFAGPGGANWQQVFAHPDSLKVSDIEVDSLHPDTIYVSFAPKVDLERGCSQPGASRKIYQLVSSTPVSSSLSITATNITKNLPAGLCVNALAIDPRIPRTVYAATTRGMYRGRSNATGGPWVWESYNDGMARTDVRDLEVDASAGQIYAATFGRGALKVTLTTTLPVSIDIKPGTSDNVINIKNKGKIPVAILSSITFDAPNEVDKTSLTFGRTGNEASLASCDAQDVNGDGLLDLICSFYTSLTGFQVSDTLGFLKGLTVEGVQVEGSDAVRILNR